MKKLLLLLLLFGFSALGADKKPIPSVLGNGLEGIAKDGIDILVEDYSEYDKITGNTFDKKAIENQVKLRLVQAGITVKNDLKLSYIYINAQPHQSGLVFLAIKAKRYVIYEANGKPYRIPATVWDTGAVVGRDLLKEDINKFMDEFIVAYLKANPKKAK